MLVKLDRDESLLWFVSSDERFATRYGVELSLRELHDFKVCENTFFAWQNKLSDLSQKDTSICDKVVNNTQNVKSGLSICPRKGAKHPKSRVLASKKRHSSPKGYKK